MIYAIYVVKRIKFNKKQPKIIMLHGVFLNEKSADKSYFNYLNEMNRNYNCLFCWKMPLWRLVALFFPFVKITDGKLGFMKKAY